MCNPIITKLKKASAELKRAADVSKQEENASKQASDPARHDALTNHYYQVHLNKYLNILGGSDE